MKQRFSIIRFFPDDEGKFRGSYAGFSASLNLQLWDVKTISDSGETLNLQGGKLI